MKTIRFAVEFAFDFVIVLAVSAAVTFLYSLLVHSSAIIDWGTSFRLALILGIVLPIVNQREKK
ncbi:MAG: hypothetical protein ACM3Q4_09180 [Acidobacteriota bacterium]